jgi:hypothetical protein
MSRPDAAASTALVQEKYIRPVLFAYMDFVGDPVRANNSNQNISVTGSGKPDLDGVYDGVTADFGDVSPLSVSDGGSGTVTFKLSGLAQYDDEMLDLIHNRTNWQGRTVRLWRLIRDASNADRGTIQHFYTGYMVDVVLGGSPEQGQWIEVSAENYLVAFAAPSNATYLNQAEYDPGDMSANAAIAAANGNDNSLGSSGGVATGSGGGGGSGILGRIYSMRST